MLGKPPTKWLEKQRRIGSIPDVCYKTAHDLLPILHVPGVARVVGFQDVLSHLDLEREFQPEEDRVRYYGYCPFKKYVDLGKSPRGHDRIYRAGKCQGTVVMNLDRQAYTCPYCLPDRAITVVRFVQVVTEIANYRKLRAWFADRFGPQIFAGDGIHLGRSFRGQRLPPLRVGSCTVL